jgi:hypothetical protein
MFQAWFTTKRAGKSSVRHIQTLHEKGLPLPRRFPGWRLAQLRVANDFR